MKTIMTTKLSSTSQIPSCLEKLIHQCQTSKPLSALAEGFSEFLYTKIEKLTDKLKLNMSTQNPSKYIKEEYQTDKQMHIFIPVFHTDVIEIVKLVPQKSCKLDPIPSKVCKHHVSALAYRIANIINTSFVQGYVCV